ncbi:hypothetical protein NMG60_11029000 [Bertholletia excelsa]
MDFEKEIQSSLKKTTESFDEAKKHPKLTYTRDFLLSLSQLDICKKLPSGFDRSILSEFDDAYQGAQDWQRIPGSLPVQSYRRTEYGASPPTRGDSGNYSWGVYGRWDNRSAGRSERDSDSQSDRDSESGRRYNNQSRRSWQSPEHDGLLGSGSFPRPSGYAAGLSPPKVQSNDDYQLNRSNEPYHPPRPYKALPHTRRETKDSYNEETFGSTEYTSQDRAEEERRRRESFELMRKEQQKALQGKQNLNLDKHHDNILLELVEDTEGKRAFNGCNEFDESVLRIVSNNDSNRPLSQAPGSRPLVPPGFKSTSMERNSTIGSLTHSHLTEVGRPEIQESLSYGKAIVQNGTFDNQKENELAQEARFSEQQHEKTRIQLPSFNKGDHLEVSNDKLDTDNKLYRISSLSEDSEIRDGSGGIELSIKTVMGPKTIGDSKPNDSMSILDKLFDGALTVNLSESSGFIEHRNTERDDLWSPSAVRTSKFAHWFLEDEKKLAPDLSSSSDLLSLIVAGEKGRSQVSDTKSTKHMPSDLPFQSSRLTDCNLEANVPSTPNGISEKLYNSSTQEAVPAILTCEDLEQTIMSEYSGTSSTFQGWNVSAANTEESKANVDDCASQYLLSLLQKGTNSKGITQSLNQDGGPSDQLHVSDQAIAAGALETSREEKAESNKTLTLETLFGSAFMKELKSAEAPVSVQRVTIDSARTGISDLQESSSGGMVDGLFPITAGIGSNSSHESNVLQSGERQQSNSDTIGNWFGINNNQARLSQLKNQNEKLDGNDGEIDIQLPEEESLFSVGNPVNSTNPLFVSTESSNKEELLFFTKPLDITEKLAALSTGFRDERPTTVQESLPFIHGPRDPIGSDIHFQHAHSQPFSSQFHPQQNHVRPFFPSFDLHPNHASSQMNLMPSEGSIHHDAPVSLQFSANMHCPPFHHPNTGPVGFDLTPHSMLQQMQNSFPPPHLLQEYPRGGPLPPHPSTHGASFMQEPHPMQSHPFDQQQHNFSGNFGMPLQAPGSGGGSNHPEAFQRLLEMELRAKSKQIHPFAHVGQSQEIYGQDLDLGFRYR